mgnify:CR=1 FL=1
MPNDSPGVQPLSPRPPRPDWRLLLRMTRPGFLTVTAAGCLLGLASAAATGRGLDIPKALPTVVLALLAHAGGNVLNDYFDARNGADAANTSGLFPFSGGSRLIQNGVVSMADTGRWAAALLILLIPPGLLLALHSGGGLVAIGVAGLLLAWAYSAPPLALMSRGLGELAVAGAWWLVVVGADYVQRGQFFVVPAVIAVSYALLVANILLINGFPDAEADGRVGKATLVVRLSPRRAAWLYGGIALLAHGWLALTAWRLIPQAALWGLLSLPLSLTAGWLLVRHADEPRRLRPAIVLSIAAAVVHGLAVAGGLVSQTWA